jgi:rfaE bifunctional protein nucleotidyltransferase chain/domain/rfaE bifunctional protein kinase chain/domain
MVSEHASPLAVLGGVDAGGQNVHVAALATWLARRGCEVVVHTRRDDPSLPRRVELAPGVVVDHVDAGPAEELPKDELLPHMAAFGDELADAWADERPDVVHSHFWMSALAALDGTEGKGIPLAHTFHALGVVKRRHQGADDTSPTGRVEIERRIARDVDRVVATCTDEVFELVRLGADRRRMNVVPCGVDRGVFTPDGPVEPRPAGGRRRLVMATRLVRRKGVEDAIRALALLPDVELHVVGGGGDALGLADDPEAVRLHTLAEELGVVERLRLRGRVAREDMPVLLRGADAVLCPAWYEPFGIVPLEAMACGVPVVATAVGGHVDSVVHGLTGMHVPPHDPEAIAAAVADLFSDDERRTAFGEAGVRRVAERFGWERVAAATRDVYEELVLAVVGDALLDRDLAGDARRLAPDAPVPVVDGIDQRSRPGGAGLAALLAARAGAQVALVSPVGDDAAGRELCELLTAAGVTVHALALDGETPEKVRVLAAGRPVVRLDRGGDRSRPGPLTAAAREAIAQADAVLVADYGRGLTTREDVRAALAGRPLVWDPHPRGAEPVPGALLVTPNAAEAAGFTGTEDPERAARTLLERWHAVTVCVTRGRAGALLVGAGPATAIPASPATGDPCGAGDCFAATAAVAVARGALPSAAAEAAVAAASAFVAAGGAGGLDAASDAPVTPTDDALAAAAAVRARGGTVVATGGCFDLLHAGHVRMLQAARAQGDCLVVLLNSDASVRRLKGPDRPLVGEVDRAAVLRSLRGVDGVIVFEEDEPSRALERLRPDVWVKGGDYAVADLPEAEALASWGGRIVLVPYVAGRSTTRLIEEAVARAS